ALRRRDLELGPRRYLAARVGGAADQPDRAKRRERELPSLEQLVLARMLEQQRHPARVDEAVGGMVGKRQFAAATFRLRPGLVDEQSLGRGDVVVAVAEVTAVHESSHAGEAVDAERPVVQGLNLERAVAQDSPVDRDCVVAGAATADRAYRRPTERRRRDRR